MPDTTTRPPIDRMVSMARVKSPFRPSPRLASASLANRSTRRAATRSLAATALLVGTVLTTFTRGGAMETRFYYWRAKAAREIHAKFGRLWPRIQGSYCDAVKKGQAFVL